MTSILLYKCGPAPSNVGSKGDHCAPSAAPPSRLGMNGKALSRMEISSVVHAEAASWMVCLVLVIRRSSRQKIVLRLGDVASHRLCELRVDFISDRHYPNQQEAEVHFGQIVLQCLKDTDLQHT